MNIISWNLGLTCEKFRRIFMGIKCNIKTSVDKISTKILKYDADIYMFQEVMYGFNRLNENITKTYPYHFYVEYLGLAVFSKTPINPITYTLLPKDWFNYILGFSNGYMIFYLPEYNKYVCNIHLSCGFRLSSQFIEIEELISEVKALSNKIDCIIGGDFNFTREKFNSFCNHYNVINDENNREISYHYFFNINLDYLLCKTDKYIKELKWNTIKSYESDHLPIMSLC